MVAEQGKSGNSKAAAEIPRISSRTSRGGKKRRKRAPKKAAVAVDRKGRWPSLPFPPVPFLTVLPLADAIQQYAAGQPTRRITIFDKLGKSPASSASRPLITPSTPYGVTKGSYTAAFIDLTPL